MTAPEKRFVTLTATGGLLIVAVLHCFGMFIGNLAVQQSPRWLPQDISRVSEFPPESAPVGGYNFDTSIQGQVGPRRPVNEHALDEIKQQCPQGVPCNPQQLGPGEYVVPGSVRVVTTQPVANPTISPRNPAAPAASQPRNVRSTPATKVKPHLAVFVDSTPLSREVLGWFRSHPNLVTLRSNCHYQEYTPANAIYRTRYASLIPPDRFPAVVLMQSDGGHIYVGSGSMLPATPDQLHDDMRAANKLLLDVVKNSPAATQAVGEATGPCPDGSDTCPYPNDDVDDEWALPRQPDRDGLFPVFPRDRDADPSDPLQLLRITRTSSLDSLTLLVAVIVAGVILFVVLRK